MNFENVAMKYNFVNINMKSFSVLLTKRIPVLWTRKFSINKSSLERNVEKTYREFLDFTEYPF